MCIRDSCSSVIFHFYKSDASETSGGAVIDKVYRRYCAVIFHCLLQVTPVSYTHLDVYKRQHMRTTPDDDMAEDTFAPEEEVELMNEEETQVDPRWDELKKILDNN